MSADVNARMDALRSSLAECRAAVAAWMAATQRQASKPEARLRDAALALPTAAEVEAVFAAVRKASILEARGALLEEESADWFEALDRLAARYG